MKKRFNLYAMVWTALLVLFNVVTFVTAIGTGGTEHLTGSFWLGYIFITIAFVGQLICSYMAFKSDSAQKTFYNISLIRTSWIGLIVSFIVGTVFMVFSFLPEWLGSVLCCIVLAFNIISVVKATAVIGEVSRIDEKIKVQTFFIKSLTVDADTLMASAKSDEAKAECKKVYEAIRYSDPMSHDALASVEGEISIKFAALSDAVRADDIAKVKELANEVIILVGNRNSKCKILK